MVVSSNALRATPDNNQDNDQNSQNRNHIKMSH
jgi:hypothetical protein